jgi:predicted phosphodiesterase
VRRVAVLGDVHGNAVALAAVLDEVRSVDVDLVVWMGDISWGWEPGETLELVRSLELPARYVRGNAERALLELRDGRKQDPTEREAWLLALHSDADLGFLSSFEPSFSVDVGGLGATRFCHGSPRTDEECLTGETPVERLAEATAEMRERVLVSAHTHVQFDREAAGVRSVNAGSVGMPYEGRQGAYWALLGPGVEHRRTEYDVALAVERVRRSGDPRADEMVEILVTPPGREEAIEHAERVRFSG